MFLAPCIPEPFTSSRNGPDESDELTWRGCDGYCAEGLPCSSIRSRALRGFAWEMPSWPDSVDHAAMFDHLKSTLREGVRYAQRPLRSMEDTIAKALEDIQNAFAN
jgi:hypothetical protein